MSNPSREEGLRVRRSLKTWSSRIWSCLMLLILVDAVRADRPQSASAGDVASTRDTIATHSLGQFLATHGMTLNAPNRRELFTRDLSFPRRPRVSRSYGPLRHVTFLNGDRISAEVVRIENDLIELRLRGGQRVTVQREAVSSISVLPGETELLSEEFESSEALTRLQSIGFKFTPTHRLVFDADHSASGNRSLKLDTDSSPVLVEIPDLSHSRIQFWFRLVASDDQIARINFEFGPNRAADWQVEVSRSTVSISGAKLLGPSDVQCRVPLRPGWHCLIAITGSNRSLVMLDDDLLMSTVQPVGRLHGIRFSADADFWVDSLIINQLGEGTAHQAAGPSTQDDTIHGTRSFQWYGRVKQLDSNVMVLTASGRDKPFAWNQISTIQFRQSDQSLRERYELPFGWNAQIGFQPLIDRPEIVSDRLTVTLLEIHREFLVAVHPWLGTIPVSWTDIARLRSLWFGQMVYLDGRQLHLGDAIEPHFHRPVPDGIEWEGEIELPVFVGSPLYEVWLTGNVAELEPAALDTPPASRFLRELRDGQLLTELTINDRPAGDLNRWFRFKSPLDQPQTFRIPLDRSMLRPGRNLFKLQQRPLLRSNRFDNCEISNLGLEIIPSMNDDPDDSQ